jgi:hypothetical protein
MVGCEYFVRGDCKASNWCLVADVVPPKKTASSSQAFKTALTQETRIATQQTITS